MGEVRCAYGVCMGVDYQVLFNVLAGVVGFLGGWVLNNLSKSIERLDADVRSYMAAPPPDTEY